jgi:DNA topoisomerase-1
MKKSLVIVESPAKAATINKYLGKDYMVEATVGHIKNLPKSRLGIDIENAYHPEYITIKGKAKIINKLKGLASQSKDVFIATDPDREGEAIAWHIAKEIDSKNKNIKRVLFTEITKTGVSEAMKHPREIDDSLVNSQQARRVMDRLVGYKVSPFLWRTVYRGLSAGRVQSVALRLVCERESEINSFLPVEYWSIVGEFKTNVSEPFYAKLVKIDGKEIIVPDKETLRKVHKGHRQDQSTTVGDERSAQSYIEDIKTKQFAISDVQKREVLRNPPAPFITSSLQQEASRKLRFPAKRTMMLAQQLYEGIEIGEEGAVGLITYMRTDSTRLSHESVLAVREYIYNNYGGEYLPREARIFKKGKSSQDAHEAIRPTSVAYTPKEIGKYLTKDLLELYSLIWNRFVACQMSAAVVDQTSVLIEGGGYLFKATGSVYRFRGFLQVYDEDSEGNGDSLEEDEEVARSRIPSTLLSGQPTVLLSLFPHQHFTKPPARYGESSLVKELESLGIGRPSTYALIVSTIQERGYVEQKERRLYATALGMDINRILTHNFPDLFNVKFTARMEDELDTIASGKQTFKKVLDDFYVPFIQSLNHVETKTDSIRESVQEATQETCEKCGRPMIVRWGRHGKFLACSGYPDCKNAKSLENDGQPSARATGEKCELCGGDIVVKRSRYGFFYGCSNYPTCKNTKPITLGIKCPRCGEAELTERRTKRKKVFYGCARYPACDFASWDRPLNSACSICGSNYLVEKFSQGKGNFVKCPACKAEFTKALEPLTVEEEI